MCVINQGVEDKYVCSFKRKGKRFLKKRNTFYIDDVLLGEEMDYYNFLKYLYSQQRPMKIIEKGMLMINMKWK